MPELDETQQNVYRHFSKDEWLGNPEHVKHLIDWVTFWRRNIEIFIQDYFGIQIYPYEQLAVYRMNEYNTTVIVASRGTAKSYILSLYAAAVAVLYPGSMILIASATKTQAGLLVTAKLQKEIIPRSPTLEREILKVKDNGKDIEVLFKNDASITVVVGNENARGYRSNFLILEEFRKLKKNVVDGVLIPTQEVRQPPYHLLPQYSKLIEQPKKAYISSSGTTGEWIWKTCKDAIKSEFSDRSQNLLAFDEAVVLKHGLKTREQLLADKKSFDDITFRIEVLNEMLRENTKGFFAYKMLEDNQRQKKCFYPIRRFDYLSGKISRFHEKKQPGEIRILSCDIAFVNKKNNDNSCYSLIRLLPETVSYENIDRTVSRGYRRVVPYLQAKPGSDVDKQAIEIKQLFEDFDADYLVLDARNGGITLYDRLAKVLYDEERDKEYRAWTCINDESVANRVVVEGALPVVFVINATQKLNSDIALTMREVLTSKRIDFLVNDDVAIDEILSQNSEYLNSSSAEEQLFFERPYLETQKLISEMVALEYSVGENTGVYVIHEVGTNTKDRYTSVSYGNYFASLLERDLISDKSDYDYVTLVG